MLCLRLRLAVDRDRPADVLGEEPGVVEAEQVVGVGVREGDRMDLTHPLAEQLQAHLGGGVDQQVAAREAHQDAGTHPRVPRVVREADPAVAAEHGDARRSAAAQDHQAPRAGHHFHHEPSLLPPPRMPSEQAVDAAIALIVRPRRGRSDLNSRTTPGDRGEIRRPGRPVDESDSRAGTPSGGRPAGLTDHLRLM